MLPGRALVFLLCLSLAPIATAQSQVAHGPIFIVRHAERADDGGQMDMKMKDPDLSDAGHARARRLAEVLRSADIEYVYASEYKRTQQTAAPLAEADHLKIEAVPAKNVDELVGRVLAEHGRTLVVAHSDTIPDILKALGVSEHVEIGEMEYDNLFVVVRPETGPSVLARLRF
jgi:broad specificity phosphatase PhoE